MDSVEAKDPFLLPASLSTQSTQGKYHFFKIQDRDLTGFLFLVFSANSVGSVRDKGFFLSPASLGAAEFTGKAQFLQNTTQGLYRFSFSGLLCEPCGLCERQRVFSLARFARAHRAHREKQEQGSRSRESGVRNLHPEA